MAVERTIAVVNGKGGVFKTSLCANVGGLLGEAGHKVLLIDLDPQANLGEDLGYEESEKNDKGAGLFQALSFGGPLQPTTVRENVEVIPSGPYVRDLAAVLEARRQRDGGLLSKALAKSLAPIADRYDVILLDCPPGVGVLHEIALGAARWVLIPAKTDASSRKGFREIARQFVDARDENPELTLLGVVITGVTTSATRVRAEARADIEAELRDSAPVFETTIRHVEAAAVDSRNAGKLVGEIERDLLNAPKWYERDDNSPKALAASAPGLAGDYQRLAEEIVERMLRLEKGEDA